ncbi:MAG TPA: PKD domain-containing protein [Firmicutes bacterium]|nr:PKD domain-containing protein [Bacillota bacterium]
MSRIAISRMTEVLFCAVFVLSCAHENTRFQNNEFPVAPELKSATSLSMDDGLSSVHYLWGYYHILIDPLEMDFEIIPVRTLSGHWNILYWLEKSPCADCLEITGFSNSDHGTKLADIKITHPFDLPNITGFDVRGIVIFNGSGEFPISGLTFSDSALGDGELINPDGHTALYNSGTAGSGPDGFQGYLKGKFATATTPDSGLNGYIRYISDDPSNTRNAFFIGEEITRTFDLIMPPAPIILGYAVDASWSPPTVKPVTDPMTQFPTEANSPEAWKISVAENPIGQGLTEKGGSTILTIDVYDWQGSVTVTAPKIECPELFDGFVICEWVKDEADYSQYEATVENALLAPVGTYRCLIAVEDILNGTSPDWLDLTAYRIIALDIDEFVDAPPVALAKAEPNPQVLGEPVNFSDDGSYDPDGGDIVKYEWDWDNDGTFDEEGDNLFHTWNEPGIYEVQFRVTDDEGTSSVLDSPLEIVVTLHPGDLLWAKRAGGTGNDEGTGIATLSDDSTVVIGSFTGTATFGEGEPNETQLVSKGSSDIFIARWNIDGELEWAKRAGGKEWDESWGITAFSDDSVAVAGYFMGTAIFGLGEPNETQLESAGSEDLFIARYNSDGSLLWAKRAGGTDSDSGYSITALSDNSVIVCGYFESVAIFGEGEPNEIQLDSSGGYDIFVARYNSVGALEWAKNAGGAGDDRGFTLTTLSDNSVVISGWFQETSTFGSGEPNETLLVSVGYYDIFLARYNPDGTLAWASHAGGSGYDVCNGITTLSDNSIVITGSFQGTATFGEGEPNETQLDSSISYDLDIFIACYNPDGSFTWAKRAGGAGTDYGYGITSLSDNSTVLTGYFEETALFGPDEQNETQLVSSGGRDIFIAHFNPDGSLSWAKRADGTSSNQGRAITALSEDSTVAVGKIEGIAIFGPDEFNQTQLQSAGIFDIFIARFLQ